MIEGTDEPTPVWGCAMNGKLRETAHRALHLHGQIIHGEIKCALRNVVGTQQYSRALFVLRVHGRSKTRAKNSANR